VQAAGPRLKLRRSAWPMIDAMSRQGSSSGRLAVPDTNKFSPRHPAATSRPIHRPDHLPADLSHANSKVRLHDSYRVVDAQRVCVAEESTTQRRPRSGQTKGRRSRGNSCSGAAAIMESLYKHPGLSVVPTSPGRLVKAGATTGVHSRCGWT